MHCADRISCNGVGGDGGYYGVWGGPVLGAGVEEWDGGWFWGGKVVVLEVFEGGNG